MGVFRRNFNRCTYFTLAAGFASALTASTVSAQAAEGNWGAEGRIGSGQAAYVSRWFNANWSLLMGGGFSTSSSENPANNSTNDIRTANVQAIVRREWGGGRVHPFFGFGPILNVSHSVNKSPTGGANSEITSDNLGFGGRFEFGALGHITQSVDLGLVLSASGTHNELKSKSTGSTVESKASSKTFSLGNPQFVIRVRF